MELIDMRVRLPDEFRSISKEEMIAFYGKYNEVLGVYKEGAKDTEQLLANMDEAGVKLAVVHAEYEFGEDPDVLNLAVKDLVNKYPERFEGFGTVDLNNLNPTDLMKQARDISSYGLKGINLQPVFFEVDPLDRRLYPLYAVVAELGLIVSFHTGIHYSLKHAIKKNSPLFLDQLAVDFPSLQIMACHAGWPWIHEMVAVARRHKNIFIEFGGVDPKYIGMQGTGWDPLNTLMNNLLSDQVLFGTDWPVMTMERAKANWEALDLKEKVLRKLFFENAQKLLT